MREAELYPDLKAYLEGQGYVVKAEIGACDLMARRGDEPAVVVEMKTSFSLALVMQGVARQAMFEDVYLAVPVTEKGWKLRYKDIVALCRRLGLGLLAVRVGQGVEAHLDPAPYVPRRAGPLKAALVAQASGVSRATALMAADHYGWFERVARGIYGLTPKGVAALTQHDTEIAALGLGSGRGLGIGGVLR
jgi:hypothetical protein